MANKGQYKSQYKDVNGEYYPISYQPDFNAYVNMDAIVAESLKKPINE